MSVFNLYVNGKVVTTDKTLEVINPATETVAGYCPIANEAILNDAVAAAKSAFDSWSQTDDDVRAAKLHQLAAIIEENTQPLAELLTLETGKAMQGMGSYFEVGGSVAWAHCTADMKLPVEVLEENDQHRIELHRKPLGVVGSIIPWNFPLMIAIWHIFPALRVGNTVVLKPSELAPLTVLKMVELFNEVLPAGVLNVVAGYKDLGRQMTEHPDIQKISFTGSTNTGKAIMANSAPTLKRLTLELGGNDAAIILPDVDCQAIAPGIVQAAFVNSGQTCAALKRLYVHDSIYDEMCEALAKECNNHIVGNGLDEGVSYGPIQNQAQFDFVCELARDTKVSGGRFVIGGEPTGGDGYFFPLSIAADVTNGMRVVDEEAFGPILPVIRYSDVDDVVKNANANSCGLGGSVWSADVAKASKLASQLECGTAWVNTHAQIQPNVPFGGVKGSGFGVQFSTQGLKECTSIQVLHINKV